MRPLARTLVLVADLVAEFRMRLPALRRPRATSDVIVSLTSFPARVGNVWLCLESLKRQTVAPSRIVLVLGEDRFPGRVLPRRLEATDVEVLWVERDMGCFTKLIPAVAAFPGATVVTADDDVIYPRTWLEALVAGRDAHPGAIVGLRASQPTRAGDAFAPYVDWPGAALSARHPMLKGNGGILYPPNLLPSSAFDVDNALRVSPTNDDLWFWAAAQAAAVPVRKLPGVTREYRSIRRSQSTSLREGNVTRSGNDELLCALLEYFGLDLERVTDPL